MSRTAELPPTPIRRARAARRPLSYDLQQMRTSAPPRAGAQPQRREVLYCGSIQPFTSQQLIEPYPDADPLSASLGTQNLPEPRQQVAPKSSGCGAQVHAAAVPEMRMWSAGARGVARTVITLDEQYVTPQACSMLDLPGRERCGCESEYVGCAVCFDRCPPLFLKLIALQPLLFQLPTRPQA
ncbi:hypothetical protein DFH06DRAFT_1241463 [Mycena polygramma]|nr:hypothetical protein DFH06DRAFT_1241463 [Mycena polygramma]